MFGATFKQKYALSDQGVTNAKKGTFWTLIVNLVVMGGIGILYLQMTHFMNHLLYGAALPRLSLFLILIAVFLVVSLITHLQQYQATYGLVYKEVKQMRIGLAEQLRRMPMRFFSHRDLADLTETIMGDVNRMEHVWSHVLGYLYGSYLSTAIVAAGLFFMDWRMALASLWSVPVAFLLLSGSRRMTRRNTEQSKNAALQVSDHMQEMLENVREIRATNHEERYLEELDDCIDAHETSLRRSELLNGFFVNGASAIMRLGVATTVLCGTGLMLSGHLDFMTFFLFLLVITRIYAPFDQSLALIAEVMVSEVSARRLREIHDRPPAEGRTNFHPKGYDIEFRHVGFTYDSKPVLLDVSFTAREGEVTALVGPSGSGKSTCARLAARLWDATEGSIRVGGEEIAEIDPEVLMGVYSMVFQDVVLFDDTVMENIRLGRHGASDDDVRQAAAAAHCDEFVRNLPDGYETRIGENGARLSGGERQRISIARALLKDAPIVLLDEATASLDVENETKVQSALSALLAQKTVLVIAHRMRTVAAADHVIVLRNGRVAEEGRPRDLLAQHDSFFRHMSELQAQGETWQI